MSTAFISYPQPRSPRTVGVLTAVALHGLAGTALLSYEPARQALIAAAPIMVELIAPPAIEPKPAPVEIAPAPKPPVKPRPTKPEPLVSAPAEALSPVLAPPPPPQPLFHESQAPMVAAPIQAPASAPVTAPVFHADYLHNPPPAYPQPSRRLGEEGRVILRVLVNPSGRADEVQIRTSSGHGRLDQAARDTVRGWKFVPAKRGDEPVAAWVLIPISFRLEG